MSSSQYGLRGQNVGSRGGTESGTEHMSTGMGGSSGGMESQSHGGGSGGSSKYSSSSTSKSSKDSSSKLDFTHSDSIINCIVKDHQRVKSIYSNYKACAVSDVTQREHLAAALIKDISVHSFLEENVLYSRYPMIFGDEEGKMMQEKSVAEHQKVKEGLYDLDQNLKVESEGFDPKLDEVMKHLLEHMADEEENFLVKVQQTTPPEKLIVWGKDFEGKRAIAPTRPHPAASSSTAAGLMAKPYDALRDIGRGGTGNTQEMGKKQ